MMNEFVWYVHQSGHQIGPPRDLGWTPDPETGSSRWAPGPEIGCNRSDGPWIRPIGPPTTSPRDWRLYAPLRDDTTIFRKFVDLNCQDKPEHVVDFANQFGLLTDPQGEPLVSWEAAIADMRPVVEFWEQAHTAEVSIDFDQPVTRSAPDVGNMPQFAGRIRRPLEFQGRNVFEFLADEINQRILQIRTFFAANADDLVDGLTLRTMPTTLLNAMWLQFGQAVAANRSFRKCRQCGTWFDMSPKAARIDRVFCNDACKAKAYRRRQAQKDDDPAKLRELFEGNAKEELLVGSVEASVEVCELLQRICEESGNWEGPRIAAAAKRRVRKKRNVQAASGGREELRNQTEVR